MMSPEAALKSTPWPHPRRMWVPAVFLTLSLIDLCLTWLMLQGPDGGEEANPIAAEVLARFGWLGLAVHKLACVGLILAIAGVVARRRPRLGRFVLRVGCLSVLAVVAYSLWLLLEPRGLLSSQRQLVDAEQKRVKILHREVEQQRFRSHADRLTALLARAEITLPDAAADLVALVASCESNPFDFLEGIFDDLAGEPCLAAFLVYRVGQELSARPSEAGIRLQSLTCQFAVYDVPLPSLARAAFVRADFSGIDQSWRWPTAIDQPVATDAEAVLSTGPELTVAGVAETGDNVGLGVEMTIECGQVDRHVGIGALQSPHAFWSGDQAEVLDTAQPPSLKNVDRRHRRAPCRQHRVHHETQIPVRFRR
jgi:hypothetical protein